MQFERRAGLLALRRVHRLHADGGTYLGELRILDIRRLANDQFPGLQSNPKYDISRRFNTRCVPGHCDCAVYGAARSEAYGSIVLNPVAVQIGATQTWGFFQEALKTL